MNLDLILRIAGAISLVCTTLAAILKLVSSLLRQWPATAKAADAIDPWMNRALAIGMAVHKVVDPSPSAPPSEAKS